MIAHNDLSNDPETEEVAEDLDDKKEKLIRAANAVGLRATMRRHPFATVGVCAAAGAFTAVGAPAFKVLAKIMVPPITQNLGPLAMSLVKGKLKKEVCAPQAKDPTAAFNPEQQKA